MAELTETDIASALARGEEILATEARARAARFDHVERAVVIDLTNGCSFTFPVDLVPALSEVPEGRLHDIEILGLGSGLYWPSGDIALSVPSLIAGLFGTRRHLASMAGATRSSAKSAAARTNGAKGGRPKRLKA